jgi:hypothetical protein
MYNHTQFNVFFPMVHQLQATNSVKCRSHPAVMLNITFHNKLPYQRSHQVWRSITIQNFKILSYCILVHHLQAANNVKYRSHPAVMLNITLYNKLSYQKSHNVWRCITKQNFKILSYCISSSASAVLPPPKFSRSLCWYYWQHKMKNVQRWSGLDWHYVHTQWHTILQLIINCVFVNK